MSPGDTAFVHRRALACAQYSITFGSTPTPSLMSAAGNWLAHTGTAFAPYERGACQNYIDPTRTDWAQGYYGSNLPAS